MQIFTIIKRNKKRVFLLCLILIFAVALILVKNREESVSIQTQKIVDTVKKGNITSSISASGRVQTANYLAITTSVNGIVKQVFVKEGNTVIQGQEIMEVTLDSEGERSRLNAYSSYLKAKMSLEGAKNAYSSLESTMIQKEEAFQDVKETNSYQTHDERVEYKLAENAYLVAKNDYNMQRDSISQLEIALNNSWLEYQSQSPIVTAPTGGTIANIVSVEGTKIENSVSERSVKTVASIKKEGTPIISLDVTELDINDVKVGQRVFVTLSSIQNSEFEGSVVGIDKIGSTQNGVSNYPVIVKFGSDSDKVLPNMGVEADIVVDQKESVLYVPTSAVKNMRGRKMVTVVKDGVESNVEVQTGISDVSRTEIILGVSEGDQIVIELLPTEGFTTQNNTQFRGGFGSFGGFTQSVQRR